MNTRFTLIGLAGGGLLATAVLQAAAALADAPSDTGADAFTIGSYTFDPYTASNGVDVEGFTPVSPLSSGPPLLTLGGGTATVFGTSIPAAPQDFDVYNSSGTALGSITGNETVANFAGLTNTEFTVASVTPATGETAADLPATGTVYDEFNLGHGYFNVYTATPDVTSASGTVTPGTVTDTLVTPYGDQNLSSLFGGFNDANPLQPGDAFTGLQAGDSSIGTDAFSIGGNTLDPFTGSGASATEGFAPVDSLASAPPLLDIGGASLGNPVTGSLVHQSFDFYSGTGSSATDVGTITTGEDVTNLLGDTNTQLVVTGSTAASGDTTAQAADLPANGTVYDAFNLGHGYENVYTATPDVTSASGTVTPGTVTDTLVTPYGDENLSSLFAADNAANPLNPGDAFTGLQSGDSSIGAGAFTLDGTTFDPVSTSSTAVDGFNPVYQTVGAPPLLEIGGGTPLNGLLTLAPQTFDIYSGSGSSATDVGSITTSEDVTNLLGLTNTEFTVKTVTPATGDTATETAALPAKGDVYDAFNFGHGFENVYTATPGADGTVTDTLVTPFGNFDLSSLFSDVNAANPLDPGAAFDVGSAAATIDPLSFLGL